MDRLHEMAVFVAVADAGSLVKAGAKLRLSPPAVTRTIARLEERLGTQLLQRTTRSLSLTDPGARFLDHCRRLLAEIDSAEREASGEASAPQGHLTLTASVTFGRAAVAGVVRAFLQEYPRVSASVLLLDRVTHLVEEGIDLAVRIGDLPDSSLVARRVGQVRRLLVASPDYLARHGIPAHPADLRQHDLISFSSLTEGRDWRFVEKGKPLPVALSPRLTFNDSTAMIDAAEAGEGLTLALSYMVAERLRAGVLVPVLSEYLPGPVPVQLVYPQTRLVAPKLRAFMDFAAPRLSAFLERVAI